MIKLTPYEFKKVVEAGGAEYISKIRDWNGDLVIIVRLIPGPAYAFVSLNEVWERALLNTKNKGRKR